MMITWTDYETYSFGAEQTMITEDEFPRYAARAGEILDDLTMERASSVNLSARQRELLIRAACQQIDYLGMVGVEVAFGADSPGGYTVGKTAYAPGAGKTRVVSSAARRTLFRAGLLFSGIATAQDAISTYYDY